MVRNKQSKTGLEDLAAERAVLAGLCQYGLDTLLDVDFLDVDHLLILPIK